MIRVVFKNMARSEAVKSSVVEKLNPFHIKFPELRSGNILVTIEVQNSPEHAGQDLYTITLQIFGNRYNGVRLRKSSVKLYGALGAIADHLLERLNRFGDRARIKERRAARRISDICYL